MDTNSQIEFRELLAFYVKRCGEQGFDQHTVLAGMILIEQWIDRYADKKLLNAVSKDIKLRRKE